MSHFDLKLAKINKWLLYSVPILPLLFIDGFFYPFVLGRTMFFRMIILAVTAIQLYLYFKKPDFKWQKNWPLILFGILIAWYLISAALGLDFYKSFFSTFERLEGLLLWLFLWVYLWLLQVNFKKIEDWYRYFKIILWVSALVSIYGLIQRFAIFNVFHAGIDRAASTLDNAAFLGSYLLLALALGLILYFKEKSWQRWLYLVINLLNLWVLYLTYTRGALLGLLVALVVWAFLFLWFKKSWYRWLSMAMILLVVLGGFLLQTNLSSSNNFLVNRFANALQDPAVQNRLLVWKKSIAAAPEHLLAGVGWENFDIVYNKFYTPDITEDWFDRSHNILVDLLVMTGVVGLALYLLWYLIFLIKAYRLSRLDSKTGLILFSFLIGYLVNNLFLFETINTAFILVALFGFVFFKTQFDLDHQPLAKLTSFRKIFTGFSGMFSKIFKFRATDQFLVKLEKAGKFLRYLPIVIAIVLFYYVVYIPTSINRQAFNGMMALPTNKEKAFDQFTKASSRDYAINEISKQLQDSYQFLININASRENQYKFFRLAEEKMWRSVLVYPWDVRIHLFLGQLIINSYNEPADIKKAEELLLKAKELSPDRPEVYYLLGQTYIKMNEQAKSFVILEELANRLPNFADVKLTLANLYWYTDKEKAKTYFEAGMALPFVKNKDNYERIIPYLLNTEDYKRALPYLVELIKDQPGEYKYRLDLSRVYYLTGDLNAALEQIEVLRTKAPNLLEDQQGYLNLLEQAKSKK